MFHFYWQVRIGRCEEGGESDWGQKSLLRKCKNSPSEYIYNDLQVKLLYRASALKVEGNIYINRRKFVLKKILVHLASLSTKFET